ncbi:F-box protein [Musa troglodytarum]|uniref:F-box protein n=1 Tax=Musa troglodytarum TaxID=320322 RepID=A0A9E7FZW3_9LILI|nr:F-box protein [Musa troglodytarum]
MQPSPLPAEDAVVGRSPPPSHDGCRNPDAGSSDGTGALLLVLGYLRLPDLLAFQRVSRFFRDAVAGDGLLWRRIAVQSPLSGRLTDDALLRITSRAEGKLESLALMDCWRITDDGLMQVVHRNPGITKIRWDGLFLVHQFAFKSQRKENNWLLPSPPHQIGEQEVELARAEIESILVEL